ncbi:MAG: hypothetical protein HOQ36_11985 [Nocardia sp.]|nr:hypothetical protein [Nocardia sp.]
MEAFLKDGDPVLGSVPGPLALASRGSVLWAAGGGRGESALSRFDADGWRLWPVDANGLRSVSPIDDRTVVVAGEHGYLAIVTGTDIRCIETYCDGCLYALTRVGELIWVTGDDGFAATLDPDTGELRAQPQFTSERIVRVVVAPGGELVFVAGHTLLWRFADGTVDTRFTGRAPLTDAAFAPDGSLAVTGDAGQLYLAAPGAAPVPCDGPALDLECLRHDSRRDGFLVTGADGFVGVLGRDGTLRALPAAVPPYRLTGILPWADGHLYAGWTQQGPPYRLRGALYFDGSGDSAPSAVFRSPRQDFGPPRVRTVGRDDRPTLAVDAWESIPLGEAERRLPDIAWPDCPFDTVRFYDGDLRVPDTAVLLADHDESGYAVAIRGDLIVDGTLDATAGGDGYGSLLVVRGDVWAHAAMFRYGIAASIGGALEVATVVMCDHGDDGGTLWAREIRAQVLAYSLYFPLPDAEIDAFRIGDVYGDTSFPPARGNEVFVGGVLADGVLDENTAANWLREGRPILRDV